MIYNCSSLATNDIRSISLLFRWDRTLHTIRIIKIDTFRSSENIRVVDQTLDKPGQIKASMYFNFF